MVFLSSRLLTISSCYDTLGYMKKFNLIPTLAFPMALVFIVTCAVFDTPFAKGSIDWFSFLAGVYLVAEGVYKIFRYPKPFFPIQLARIFRITIGVCIFSTHLIQFIWGVNAEILASPLKQVLIDWFAFFFGIYLIVEGIYGIFKSKSIIIRNQLLRVFRVLIGTCVFTIHLLQFMRF